MMGNIMIFLRVPICFFLSVPALFVFCSAQEHLEQKEQIESNSSNLSDLQLARRDAEDFENLAALVKPSIVIVESVDRVGREGGRGTGFVVGSNGVIATNFHVIGEHRNFKIRFANGKSYSPQAILSIDRENDLALIKIDAKDLPVLQLGNSDDISPGQSIFAIGNPLGYGHSVSRGVVAAIRELEPGDGKKLVQVAIPIEPGSSGSPTLDLDGKVIAILAIKSGGAMGFGIPVNQLKKLLKEQTPLPIKKWLTIGALDELEWESIYSGTWKQRAGVIMASGLGSGFGGRMLCLSKLTPLSVPYELEVDVRLDDERGAAGLVFHGDGENKHYGFYPTNESLRLTCFQGADVFSWNIIKTIKSSAYRPNEWNRLRVKLEEEGKIMCFVNDQLVIEINDKGLKEGRVGLCKFRAPTAEFRNFRQAKRFPSSRIHPKTKLQIKKIAKSLSKKDALSKEEFARLLKLGPAVPQALLDHAIEIQKQATRVKALSKEIKDRRAIDELVKSLSHRDKDSVNLLRSTLLLARLDNQDFDLNNYLKKAEAIADKISSYFPKNATGEEKLKILVVQLFEEMGYHGSTLDYNHPSNSYMNEVMDDREGLPITLSVLFIELANRLNLPVTGLGIPGHFLAMYRDESQKKPKEIIIDPFGGKIVSRQEASAITGLRLTDKDFIPASNRDIITRMLRNLIQSSENQNDSSATIRYINAILAIDPTDSYTRAMRAMINYGAGRYDKALEDIDSLIAENPDGPGFAPLLEIKKRLIEKK